MAAKHAAATKWTVSLASYQVVVGTGVAVQLMARSNQPVEQGKHRLRIIDVASHAVKQTCAAGLTCTASVDSHTARSMTFQALIVDNRSKIVAFSARWTIRWIKSSPWKIGLVSGSFVNPADESGMVPLGEPLLLKATVAQALEARHASIAIFAFDAQGKRTRVSTSCSHGTVCQAGFSSPQAEASWTFVAAVMGSGGKIQDESPLLLASWKQLHVTMTGPDTATAGTNIQLSVSWDLAIPAALHTWDISANGQTDQTASARCAQAAAANPDAHACSISVQAGSAGQVTYKVAIGRVNGTSPLATATHAVSWTAAPVMNPTVHISANPSRQDFPVGGTIQLTVTASPPADGKSTFLQIVGSDGSVVAKCPTGASCSGNATSAAAGTVTYTGEEVDATGKVLASDTWSITWFKFTVSAAPQGVLGNQVPVGMPANIAVSATPTVAGFTLVLTGGGLTLRCPASSPLSCIFQLTSATAQTVTYTVQVVDDATGQAASSPVTVQITWGSTPAPTFSYTVQPGTTVNVGQMVTIQVNATPAAAGTVVVITDGTHTQTCPVPTTWSCSFTFQSNVPQLVTYTIYVQGDFADAQQVQVQWAQPPGGGTPTLTLNPTSGTPTSSFNGTWNEPSVDSCDSTGTISVFFDGQMIGSPLPDPAGLVTLTISTTNAAPGSHTITVKDSCGETASATYTVSATS